MGGGDANQNNPRWEGGYFVEAHSIKSAVELKYSFGHFGGKRVFYFIIVKKIYLITCIYFDILDT